MKMQLVNAIQTMAQQTVDGIHTAFPGVILAVDFNKGTCDVQPYAMCRTTAGERMAYPTMYGVPLAVPQSSVAGACVAFPIRPGDTCLIVISEGTLDYWLFDRVTGLDSKFDLTNAICIPGLSRTLDPSFREAADGAIILKSGAGKIKLTSDSLTLDAKNININATGNVKITGARVDIN